ncbi:hypothetical protein MMC25_001192 [Agyrium rufum]|nr:hypothetical protein [Agyrium rufum]
MEPGTADYRRRTRIQEVQAQELAQLRRAASRPPTRYSITPDRRQEFERHTETMQRAHRRRRLEEYEDTRSPSPANVDRLARANSSLSSLLDEPIPRLLSPDPVTQEYADEADVNRRRSKRRRLGTSDTLDNRNISFSHRGQVVPGPLKLRIYSCDAEDRFMGGHSAENMLLNDRSIFTSGTSVINIVLAHQAETPFALTKLVIRAPSTGFIASIQEGVVFVSMSPEYLIRQTARYRIVEPPRPSLARSDVRSLSNPNSSSYRPPSRRSEYPSAYRPSHHAPDPLAYHSSRSHYQHSHNRHWPASWQPSERQIPATRDDGNEQDEEETSPGFHDTSESFDRHFHSSRHPSTQRQEHQTLPQEAPQYRSISPAIPSPYNVTTSCDSDSSDAEEHAPSTSSNDSVSPTHISTTARGTHDEDARNDCSSAEEDEEDESLRYLRFRPSPTRQDGRNNRSNDYPFTSHATIRPSNLSSSTVVPATTDPRAYVTSRRRRRARFSKGNLCEDRDGSVDYDANFEGEPNGQEDDVIPPHAKFSMEKEKSAVTVRFETAV